MNNLFLIEFRFIMGLFSVCVCVCVCVKNGVDQYLKEEAKQFI
jgi:hypothetical protein